MSDGVFSDEQEFLKCFSDEQEFLKQPTTTIDFRPATGNQKSSSGHGHGMGAWGLEMGGDR